MRHRITEETHHQDRGVLRSAGSKRLSASTGSSLSLRNMGVYSPDRADWQRQVNSDGAPDFIGHQSRTERPRP